ncbi:hypothetical protein [Buttiauxella sp. BIGb0552]|uniref:hypothetical protein n=1 Tax=Buttiauxella sp. BIGb0552 TaxID=2485120 RepID=UPI001064F5BD|nr:hypothetical protein [Buttiauxella sp. BIGb0552]
MRSWAAELAIMGVQGSSDCRLIQLPEYVGELLASGVSVICVDRYLSKMARRIMERDAREEARIAPARHRHKKIMIEREKSAQEMTE